MPFVHPTTLRAAAVDLVRRGCTPGLAASALGVATSTVYAWLRADAPELVRRPQLLGLYLGDGWLTVRPRGQCFLSIACDDRWQGLADECEDVVRRVLATAVCRIRRRGCHDIKAYSRHWLCLLPQHGPGKKHERRIVLEPWQQELVAAHPGRLLRGLFHSDGWRGHNVAVHRADDGFVTRYRYSRYEFTNRSTDIRRLCTDALDLLGIAWRRNGSLRISVNRRAAVALLDEHVGPKH